MHRVFDISAGAGAETAAIIEANSSINFGTDTYRVQQLGAGFAPGPCVFSQERKSFQWHQPFLHLGRG